MSILPENSKHRIVDPIEFRYNTVNGTLRYKADKSNLMKDWTVHERASFLIE